MKHPEDDICKAFVQELDYRIKREPKLKGLFYYHIPNGGSRHIAEAVKSKAIGVRPGVCDYFVMRASGCYHGLYIEFKASKDKKPSKAQIAFMDIAEYEKYKTIVVFSVEAAISEIYRYLELNKSEKHKLNPRPCTLTNEEQRDRLRRRTPWIYNEK